MTRAPSLLILCALLMACEKHEATTSISAAPTQPKPPPLSATDWNAAVASTMTKDGLKEKDGVQEYFACFGTPLPNQRPNCADLIFTGRLDGFSRSQRYQTFASWWQQTGLQYSPSPVTQIAPAITLVECDVEPKILLKVHYAGNSWVFMKSAAVLADGALVFTRDLDQQLVQRDTDTTGVHEDSAMLLTAEQWSALRAAVSAKELHVRVSGEKGYVMLSAKQIAALRNDIDATGRAYDKLNAALEPFRRQGCAKIG